MPASRLPRSFDLDARLPDWCAERTRVLGHDDRSVDARDGSFVLYWMHHAVRGHEHPALDVARLTGDALGLPVLVYQGLGGRHPFDNDRHHTFILEGARDAASELAARGVRHVFWLPEDPATPSPLIDLAARAALVVTEDFPAPPFPRWTRGLARRSGTPMLLVDTACIVPMRLVPVVHERAFKFRNTTKKLFRARADRPYPEIDVALPDASGIDVGFAPCDLRTVDIAEACARCAIDHGVGPVAHTRGGSAAGYARWEAFKASGLRTYHKRRNTAELDRDELTVSRMSAYLHHGHVSPFRLVRETRAIGEGAYREGAEKYIDELWVWRELAHHLAFTRADELHAPTIIPEWARATIAAHADDPRTVLDRETLARGRSGDALWDAAQRSLLAHGELHNNVRMTWGKALLRWHAGAADTQDTLIDLNHRYALDGSDPNSYGGLLWCLGVFDRPFEQDEPIYGTLRTRPTDVHAGRMDLERYQAIVDRPSWGGAPRVAVIGAGLAGLAAARVLTDHHADVTVFEAEAAPGGRLATRWDDGRSFDHGAQYFTARDPRFRRMVDAWAGQGVVARWPTRLAVIDAPGTVIDSPSDDERFVGTPGMVAVAEHLAETLGDTGTICYGRRIERLTYASGRWELSGHGGAPAASFDAVVVALPAPVARRLLDGQTALAEAVGAVTMHPCWAVLVSFEDRVPITADGLFVNVEGQPLRWAARDSSKPGRPEGERWVLHAAHPWSAAHADLEPAEVARRLLDAFAHATGASLPGASDADAVLWPHALGATDTATDALFDAVRGLAVAGDWCAGGRVEGAYLSGVAAGGRVLGHLVAASDDPDRLEPT